jgi:hypothetical protein
MSFEANAPQKMYEDTGKSSWFWRRLIIIGYLLLCGSLLLYLTIWGKDDELRRTLALGLTTLAGTIITGYVFGAVWDDRNFMQAASSGRNVSMQLQGQYGAQPQPLRPAQYPTGPQSLPPAGGAPMGSASAPPPKYNGLKEG